MHFCSPIFCYRTFLVQKTETFYVGLFINNVGHMQWIDRTPLSKFFWSAYLTLYTVVHYVLFCSNIGWPEETCVRFCEGIKIRQPVFQIWFEHVCNLRAQSGSTKKCHWSFVFGLLRNFWKCLLLPMLQYKNVVFLSRPRLSSVYIGAEQLLASIFEALLGSLDA